jgi:hypothetical protein
MAKFNKIALGNQFCDFICQKEESSQALAWVLCTGEGNVRSSNAIPSTNWLL